MSVNQLFNHVNCVGVSVWETVPDQERRELFEDVQFILAKREKEFEEESRERNQGMLKRIIDKNGQVTYRLVRC